MVIYENIGDNLVRAYSDAGFLIHGGFPEGDYEEAVDPADAGRTYVETDIPINPPEPEPDEPIDDGADPDEATIEDYQQALEALGVSLDG